MNPALNLTVWERESDEQLVFLANRAARKAMVGWSKRGRLDSSRIFIEIMLEIVRRGLDNSDLNRYAVALAAEIFQAGRQAGFTDAVGALGAAWTAATGYAFPDALAAAIRVDVERRKQGQVDEGAAPPSEGNSMGSAPAHGAQGSVDLLELKSLAHWQGLSPADLIERLSQSATRIMERARHGRSEQGITIDLCCFIGAYLEVLRRRDDNLGAVAMSETAVPAALERLGMMASAAGFMRATPPETLAALFREAWGTWPDGWEDSCAAWRELESSEQL